MTNENTNRQECVPSCPYNEYQYLDIKTNKCLMNCNSAIHYSVENICYPKLDVINNYLYIDSDTYEVS